MKRLALLIAMLCLVPACEGPGSGGVTPVPYYAVPNIEPGERIAIQRGDTVYSIARRYKVPMGGIISLNSLKPPYQLREGSTLVLPAKEILVAPHKMDAPPPEPARKRARGEPLVIEQPIVTDGAMMYSQQALPPPPRPEEEVVIYAPAQLEAMQDLARSSAEKPALAPEKETILFPPAVAETPKPKPLRITPEKSSPRRKPSRHPPTVSRDTERFIWPVKGKLLSGFGKKPGGLSNDGINIAAPRGTPVIAADGGTVAYAGSDIPGYGNVVLIRHEGGWMTTYAHLERIFVVRDNITARGDVIGTVGTSGGLSSPQLHFEIRKGASARNPEKYLAGR